MFENGCFLRRQKRFKCSRKEMMRRSRRTSTISGSHVDGTPAASGDERTLERQDPAGQNDTEMTLDSNEVDLREPLEQDAKTTDPPRSALSDVGLLQATASAADYAVTLSSDDGRQNLEHGDRLTPQQHRFNDPQHYGSLALLQQCHQYQHQQSHPLVAGASFNQGYSKSSVIPGGPEVVTSTSVYDVRQRYRDTDGIPQLGLVDRTKHGLSDQFGYQSSSQTFPHELYRHLQQPINYCRYPSSYGDAVRMLGGSRATPSFAPYHAVQARFDVDHFRSSSTSLSSGLLPSTHLLPRSPSVTDAVSNHQHHTIHSMSSTSSAALNSCYASAVLPDVQRLESIGFFHI